MASKTTMEALSQLPTSLSARYRPFKTHNNSSVSHK
jgi:hypothetical protein